MSKLIVFTDIHITPEGRKIIGLDPLERFRDGLAHAAAAHPDADAMLITGDLTHFGSSAEYARLKEALSDAPWPVTLMLGNHDRREGFTAVFPDHPTDPSGFMQSVIDLPEARLICLDTLHPEAKPEHAGLLCETRLTWLRKALAEAEGRPVLVFLHHPPFDTGFLGMDDIGLLNAAEVRGVLAQAGVRHVFAGHIHRTIMASVDGVPMTVFKSTCHQMPMMLGVEGSSHSVDEPGAYGIVLLRPGGDVIVHTEDFTLPAAAVGDYD